MSFIFLGLKDLYRGIPPVLLHILLWSAFIGGGLSTLLLIGFHESGIFLFGEEAKNITPLGYARLFSIFLFSFSVSMLSGIILISGNAFIRLVSMPWAERSPYFIYQIAVVLTLLLLYGFYLKPFWQFIFYSLMYY